MVEDAGDQVIHSIARERRYRDDLLKIGSLRIHVDHRQKVLLGDTVDLVQEQKFLRRDRLQQFEREFIAAAESG